MQVEQRGSVRFKTFASFPAGRIVHAVFDRIGGVSPAPYNSLNMSIGTGDTIENVRENQHRAFQAIGLPLASMARACQVHGNRTVPVYGQSYNPTKKADALITATPGVALFMSFADCVPILLYDPVQHVIGIAHAGWRGTVSGICQDVVTKMGLYFHCHPTDILAAIGPSISAKNYPVGAEVADAVMRAFPEQNELLPVHNGKAHFDLWDANVNALRRCGVKTIQLSQLCTASCTDQYFSHRAEAGNTGRFGTVIALK